jgi:hypothetical protein
MVRGLQVARHHRAGTDGQEVNGIIECDHLPLAPRGYDLGYYLAFAVEWRLDEGNQPTRPVDEAVPFIARHVLTGYDGVSRLTREENDDVPALALAARWRWLTGSSGNTIWSRRAGCAPPTGSVTTSTRSGFPHQLLV